MLSRRGSNSRGRLGAPVRRDFVVDDTTNPDGHLSTTPLMSLVRQRSGTGGPGGQVRLKLLLSLILICADEPYDSTRDAWVWASFIGLPDPRKAGARRIRTALHELEQRKFIKLEQREKGKALTAVLLREDGSGAPYTNPVRLTEERESTLENVYFRVPMQFWQRQHVSDITTPAMVMWLILLAESRGERRPWWFTDNHARSRYGVTASFRRQGLNELLERGIVTMEKVASSALRRTTPRRVYTLTHLQPGTTKSKAQERADELLSTLNSAEREALRQLLDDQ